MILATSRRMRVFAFAQPADLDVAEADVIDDQCSAWRVTEYDWMGGAAVIVRDEPLG